MPKTATCSEIWGCLPSRVNRAVRSVALSLPCTHWRWPRPRPRPQFQAPVLGSTPAAVAVYRGYRVQLCQRRFWKACPNGRQTGTQATLADRRLPTAATANTVAPFVEWNAKCETRNANRRQRDNNKFACQHFLKPQVPSCVSGMPLGACNGSQHRSD